MKAWLVRLEDEPYVGIVFAETRGKARSMALSLDGFEDAEFTDVEARRAPYADKYYKDVRAYLDWDIPEDRIALVKDCDVVCDYDYWEREDCDTCPAKEYCDRCQDIKESEDTE